LAIRFGPKLKSRKACMSRTPNSKITAPTTISAVPAPRGADQIVIERRSRSAAPITAR
jgi:hypothetical protein